MVYSQYHVVWDISTQIAKVLTLSAHNIQNYGAHFANIPENVGPTENKYCRNSKSGHLIIRKYLHAHQHSAKMCQLSPRHNLDRINTMFEQNLPLKRTIG